MFFLGIAFGIFITIKYIAPPSEDIHIGKIKIKGKGNTMTDVVDVKKNKADEEKKKFRLFNRNK